MKNNKIKRSFLISIFMVSVFRVLLIFIPIYSSSAIIEIPKLFRLHEIDIGNHPGKENCLNMKVSFDRLNNKTLFNLNSRSLKKQKTINCIEDGANFIENKIKSNNSKIIGLFLQSEVFNERIDDLINDFNTSKSLDKDKLILINDYFRNLSALENYKKVPLALPYQIETNKVRNNNLFRYLFISFILFFWVSYVFLEDFKKPE